MRCLALAVILSVATKPSDGDFAGPAHMRPDEETQGSKRCETIGWQSRVSTCTAMHVRDPDSRRQSAVGFRSFLLFLSFLLSFSFSTDDVVLSNVVELIGCRVWFWLLDG